MTELSAVTPTRYDERLAVPLRWWVQGTMLVASIWLAFYVAVPAALAWAIGGTLFALMAGVFIGYGAAKVQVADGWLTVGHARIETTWLGRAEALSAPDSRRLAGRDANALAYLMLRPYLSRAIRVEIVDPADPAPYWMIATRHPETLVAAIEAARGKEVG